MSTLARQVDDSDLSETVMVLGGQYGLVALHVSLCGVPQVMVLHSPEEVHGWTGPNPCRRLEMNCWCLQSVQGGRLIDAIGEICRPWEEALWAVMEREYLLYLERGRR